MSQGPEARVAAAGGLRALGADEGLLRQVFGQGVTSDQAADESPHRGAVVRHAFDRRFAHRFISGASTLRCAILGGRCRAFPASTNILATASRHHLGWTAPIVGLF